MCGLDTVKDCPPAKSVITRCRRAPTCIIDGFFKLGYQSLGGMGGFPNRTAGNCMALRKNTGRGRERGHVAG